MKLMIIRHGETEENVKGICQGHLPGKLSELGVEQAKRLAERLKDEKIDVIFSSDLARAIDTAKEIIKFHPETPIYFVEALRERFFGEAQGKTKEEISELEDIKNEEIQKKWKIESRKNFIERGKRFSEKTLGDFYGKTVLFVAHGGINWAISSELLKNDFHEIWKDNSPKNTSITIFEFDEDKKPKLALMNCVKHLEDL